MSPGEARDLLQFMIKLAGNRVAAFDIADRRPQWTPTIRGHVSKGVFTQALDFLQDGHSVDELNRMVLHRLVLLARSGEQSPDTCDALTARCEIGAWAELAYELKATS